MMPLRTLLLSFLVAAVGLLAGCSSGPKGTKLTGQLMMNGKPYLPSNKVSMSIQFMPFDKGMNAPTCTAKPDAKTGEFTVVGPVVGHGILPGKYKVSVTATDNTTYQDIFKDALSQKNSPLTYDVDASPEQRIVIDIGKKTVTKN